VENVGLCCAGFINPIGVLRQRLSLSVTPIHLKSETQSSLRKIAYKAKDRTMDYVHNCDRYVNTPRSQTYRSH
jgi:hypothetical protein